MIEPRLGRPSSNGPVPRSTIEPGARSTPSAHLEEDVAQFGAAGEDVVHRRLDGLRPTPRLKVRQACVGSRPTSRTRLPSLAASPRAKATEVNGDAALAGDGVMTVAPLRDVVARGLAFGGRGPGGSAGGRVAWRSRPVCSASPIPLPGAIMARMRVTFPPRADLPSRGTCGRPPGGGGGHPPPPR